MLSAVGDDFFFAPPPTSGAQPPQPTGATPPSDPGAGMPGYSWAQHQAVQAQVGSDAGPSVPLSASTIVAAVAGLGALLMLVGSWGAWVKLTVFDEAQTVGGLNRDLDGKYVLALGIAALLVAGTAVTTGQTNLQVRQICAGVLAGLGAIGLGIVIHEWVTVSDQFRQANEYLTSFANSFSQSLPPNSTDPLASQFADGFANAFHISKGWGLTLSGASSAVTGLAGAYLFIVR